MSITVCLVGDSIGYPEGGGHQWALLNWALGLRSLGCEVIWLEGVEPDTPPSRVRRQATALKRRLAPYGLAERVALCAWTGEPLAGEAQAGCLDLAAAAEADLLINQRYGIRGEVVRCFRRSALIDIDPGLLQCWMSNGQIQVAAHDVYFTIGETVGQPGARFPDGGLPWIYTPPCVALDWWPPRRAADGAPFTTVAHWYGEWMAFAGDSYGNSKRDGFMPFLELPRHTAQPLELALDLAPDDDDHVVLREHGWRVRNSHLVASTPWRYQRYIQASRGELSCAKPSCLRLANAWISDRTLCYLASGKPAVVQHTGASRFLPEAEGLFRFRTIDDAVRCLDVVAGDYERHCRLARQLAEEHFDARCIAARLLEHALA